MRPAVFRVTVSDLRGGPRGGLHAPDCIQVRVATIAFALFLNICYSYRY